MRQRRRSVALLVTVVALLCWGCLQLWHLAAASWSGDLSGTTWRQAAHDPTAVQQLAGGLAGSAALAICAWLLLGVLISGAAALAPGGAGAAGARLARAVAPTLIRNAVAAMLGVAAVVPVAMPATAAPSQHAAAVRIAASGRVIRPVPGAEPRWQASRVVDPSADFEPGWVPTRPAPRHRAGPSAEVGTHLTTSPSRRPREQVDDVVVVRRGDTLWSLAARHLGRDASDAQIALEWPTWFAANRSTIGSDPDRLLPGMRLHAPHDVTPGGGR